MASTNMLQWNPTAANQESDATYVADSQRTGGATNPSIFVSALGNKLFFQVTTYLTALFTAFANKGFATSDSSLATLTAQCANFLTTADLRGDLQYVPYAALLTFDCTKYNGFQVLLTGGLGFTLNSPSVGQKITLAFTQDGTGGHAVSWPANVLSPGTVDTGPNKTSIQVFMVLNDNMLHPSGPMTVS